MEKDFDYFWELFAKVGSLTLCCNHCGSAFNASHAIYTAHWTGFTHQAFFYSIDENYNYRETWTISSRNHWSQLTLANIGHETLETCNRLGPA